MSNHGTPQHAYEDLRLMVKAMRKQAGFNQSELAQRIGLDRTSLCNIEVGRQPVTIRNIHAIADACGYRIKVKFERNPPCSG